MNKEKIELIIAKINEITNTYIVHTQSEQVRGLLEVMGLEIRQKVEKLLLDE